MSEMFFIRPHHCLCSQFFAGSGYSDEFVANMTDILDKLNSQNARVKIVEHCDDICSCCPKNTGGMCENEENVIQHDIQCIEEYGYKIGGEYCWNDLKEKVISKIKADNKLPSVCRNCSWLSICGRQWPALARADSII